MNILKRLDTGRLLSLALLCALLASCSSGAAVQQATQTAAAVATAAVATATAAANATPTLTLTATRPPTNTPTPTATLTPTATPTAPPALSGTQMPQSGPIIESSLQKIHILAQWGRGQVQGLAWSPDGSRLAVATPLGIYLYNTTDQLSGPTLITTKASAFQLAFSPDSLLLAVDTAAVGSGLDLSVPPHQVQVWDLSAAEPRPMALLDTQGLALALQFNSSAEVVLLARADTGSAFQRWDLASLRKTQSILLSGSEPASYGAITSNLEYAATSGQNEPMRIWRLSDGAVFATGITSSPAGALAFSPDCTMLAAAYPDTTQDGLNTNQVRVWRIPSEGGRMTQPALSFDDAVHSEGTSESLVSLAWSPDNTMLAAGDNGYTVHVWRATPSPVFRRLNTSTLPGFVAFAPNDQNRLAVGGLELFNVADGTRAASDNDYLPGLYDMDFAPDGSALALAEFGAIEFRSTMDGKRSMLITGMDGPVHAISFNPQGNYFVAACNDGTTRLYYTQNGRYLDELGEPTYPILSADFAPNNFWIASAGEDMKIRIFRLDDGKEIESMTEPFVAYKLLFSPNSNQLASLTTSGVNLRKITGSERQTNMTLTGNYGGVGLTDMSYSPGQEFLALAGSDVVRVIKPVDGTVAYTLYEPKGALPWAVAFSPDNAFLAVGWSDGQIRLYWAQDGTLMKTWQAHPESVLRLAFSRDSHLLASLGSEGTIRVWGAGE